MPKFLYPLRDFSLGLNNKDAANLIPDNALVDVQNAIIGRGFISKRHGFVKYTPNALANPIYKLYPFFKNDGTQELLSVSNLGLYKDNSGVLNAITGALSSNSVQMLTYKNRSVQDVALLADGGALKVYNGTDVSSVTAYTPTTAEQTDPGSNDLVNLIKFRALAIKKDRLFAAAHPTVKNRVSFCHHDPTLGYAVYDYWPATFFFDVAADENDEIIQLKVFRDSLIILCKRSVWILRGDGRTLQDYELHKINVPSGCISPESVTIVGNNMFYLSDDHIYSLFSTDQNYVSAEIVSQNVESTLKTISRADKEKAVGTFYDNKYYLSFPSGLCLIFDTLLGIWSKWTNIQANSFLEMDGVFYFSSSGLIYKFDDTVYSDDGQAINFSMTTKLMDFGFEVQDKKYRKLWTIAKQYDGYTSTINIKAIIDYITVNLTDIQTDISGEWDEGLFDGALWDFVDVVQNELKLREKGKNIQLVISNNELNQPLTLYGLVLQYKLKKP